MFRGRFIETPVRKPVRNTFLLERSLSIGTYISCDIIHSMDFSAHLRSARLAARLTQVALARRVGTSQSRLSSYENGSIIPNPSTKKRLLQATRRLPSEIVDEKRETIIEIAAKNGLSNVRVFGSVARLDDTFESDIDLLVTPSSETSLLELSAFLLAIEEITGREVDVLSDRSVPPESEILREALAL
jgi:predicted nucleotidyltransferase